MDGCRQNVTVAFAIKRHSLHRYQDEPERRQRMPRSDVQTQKRRVVSTISIYRPIYPPSDSGYRYILTLVDYTTRYPEAVALKKITTDDVARALANL